MESDATLAVRLDDPRTVVGPRSVLRERERSLGFPLLWVRANGSATLFYRGVDGRMRQWTWKHITIEREFPG